MTGALISLAVLIISTILVYEEIDHALGDGPKTEILFENLHMNDLLVTLDIDLIHVPCEIVDLRFTAKKGKTHSIRRYYLKNHDQDKSQHEHVLFNQNRPFKDVLEAMKAGEGCNIRG